MLVLKLQHVSSRFSDFHVASPCPWGKLQNLSSSKVSKLCLILFNVVLRDKRGASWYSRVWKSVDLKSFCVTGTILLRRVSRKWLAFFVAVPALGMCPSSFCVAGAALQTCRAMCFCKSHCQAARSAMVTAAQIVRLSFCPARAAFGGSQSRVHSVKCRV